MSELNTNQRHIAFAAPDGRESAVFIDGQCAGHIRRYDLIHWTYQPLGLIGRYLDVRSAIRINLHRHP